MRLLLFFDLPIITSQEKRNYLLFRKAIIEMGFSMVQYSVYSKIVLNHTQKESVEKQIEAICPKGDIALISLTEAQFQRTRWFSGKTKSDLLQTFDRLVVI